MLVVRSVRHRGGEEQSAGPRATTGPWFCEDTSTGLGFEHEVVGALGVHVETCGDVTRCEDVTRALDKPLS